MHTVHKTRQLRAFVCCCPCVQTLVTTELEGGDRQKAMKRLRVPPLGAAQVRYAAHARYYRLVISLNIHDLFLSTLASQAKCRVQVQLANAEE